MKRKRYTPCPVLVHPTMHPEAPALRKQGLVCMGPYHNDRWYIFHPKPQPGHNRHHRCLKGDRP